MCHPFTFITARTLLDILFPSTRTRGPTPHQEKQPQNITDPPPNFIVGLMHAWWNLSSALRQTLGRPSELKRQNRDSSVKTTDFHSSSQSRRCCAHSSLFAAAFFVRYGFLQAKHDFQ